VSAVCALRLLAAALAVGVTLSVTSCGGGHSNGSTGADNAQRQVTAASKVAAADFPATGGRTLQAIADTVEPGAQVGLATSVLLPRQERLAFGMIGKDRAFLYGKSALYLAETPNAKARGPYPAPADSIVPKPAFISRQTAADTAGIKAIYAAQVPFSKAGEYAVLAVTKVGRRLVGAATQVTVRASSPIPDVGDRPPSVDTDTLASAGGDIASIDTRVPPDDMHGDNFRDVVGQRPVALLFATPQLCQSRVCGPVTDLELQLKAEYGDRMTFIHQEVYVDNDLKKGLRPPMQAFHLETEPWLFTVDKNGRVAARLEGSFGVNAFHRAARLRSRPRPRRPGPLSLSSDAEARAVLPPSRA
jgi:hypothetical protein